MSTPPTKSPRRYKPKISNAPVGSYSSRIYPDKFALAIGRLATVWPYVEERMVGLFTELLDIPGKQSGRLIFRSIINQNIRITVMRNLLEKSPHHKDKTAYFDELIDEFASLNVARNTYLHGLWSPTKMGSECSFRKKVKPTTYFSSREKCPSKR